MDSLTPTGQQAVQQLAQRYGVSADAVLTLLSAVNAGGGTMAQFYHHELGGGGQWMRGGMTMVGDMFNGGLQAKVAGLCAELSELLGSTQVYVPPVRHGGSAGSNSWWPAELGTPSSSGGQNDMRYAYFPATRRLALQRAGVTTIYDTLDHQIGGVQQQQGGIGGSLSFSSQFGTFGVESLPQVSPPRAEAARNEFNPSPPSFVGNAPSFVESATSFGSTTQPSSGTSSSSMSADEIFLALEKLGKLVQSGVLTEAEFSAKKAELLARL
jgi:hypothetical protein